MYFFHSHNEHNKLLDIFDNANVLECYRRTESIVPQQALALANSKLSFTVAGLITGRLGGVSAASAKFVTTAFEAVLGRPPLAEELSLSEKFLAQEEQRFRGPEKPAWQGSAAARTSAPTAPSIAARGTSSSSPCTSTISR